MLLASCFLSSVSRWQVASEAGATLSVRPDCSIPGPTSLSHKHKSEFRRQTGALLALMVVSLVIALGGASRRVMSTYASQPKTGSAREGRVPLSDDAKRRLEAALADSSTGADLTTMRAFQKALTDELHDTNGRGLLCFACEEVPLGGSATETARTQTSAPIVRREHSRPCWKSHRTSVR